MDGEGDYHEPDYSTASFKIKEEAQSSAEEDKLEKIKNIIRREFANEIQVRENEVKLIDQKMSSARWLLHRLRYSVVNAFYQEQKLQLNADQVGDEEAAQRDPRAKAEVSSLLREGQRRLHPSVRKLLGKQTVGLEEIFRTRGPRNKSRKNYSAMLQPRNYTIPADRTRSLRPEEKAEPERAAAEPGASCSRPRKAPRPVRPRADRVLTLDDASRNWVKHKYRIIIGNTSKYAKPASQADRSTHKWLLYVRGPPAHPDLAPLVSAVTVHLDHSYAPHHVVHIDKPPYHLSRRGWGEFPARVELHFALPDLNRPATVQHTIKLDRLFTGLQTLGAETLIDVWLYSTPEMVQYEYKEESEQADAETPVQAKTEPMDAAPEIEETANPTEAGTESQPQPEPETEGESDTLNWMDFFTTTSKELDVDDMIIKPVKKEPEKDVENLIESSVIPKEVTVKKEVTVNGDVAANANGDRRTDATIKTEPTEWEDSRANETEALPEQLVSQTASPKKRIMKYMDPETGKIYYLEMDRKLDLSKVQEIVINSKGGVKTAKLSPLKTNGLKSVRKTPKGGVSLLKPEVKSSLKNDTAKKESLRVKTNVRNFQHDHCYLGCPVTSDSSNLTDIIAKITSDNDFAIKETMSLYDCLCSNVRRFECMRVAVNYCIKKIPLVSDKAKEPDFVRHFPFVVESEAKYWRLDFAKRRNIEWSRAKLINTILKENHPHSNKIWRTKQILVYSRLHGYHPIRPEAVQPQPRRTDGWSAWNDLETIRQQECDVKDRYPTSDDVTTLTLFNEELLNAPPTDSVHLSDSEDDIDVVECEPPVRVKSELLPDVDENSTRDATGLRVLPVENEEDRLRFLFIEKKCEDIGIELKNEDVGNGYSYSAVHAVMLSAMKSFAEELIRNSLAVKLTEERSPGASPAVWIGSSTRRALVSLSHAYRAAGTSRLQLAAAGLGAEPRDTCPL